MTKDSRAVDRARPGWPLLTGETGMDTHIFCQTRRDLEERSWVLTSRLAALTSQLMNLIGHNHDDFLTALDRCQTTGLEVTESRDDLRTHRRDHGC